ncbi:MAG: HAD-IA family hydrolase [Lactobacillus sp.]|uniref:Haloacid dehalogenase n=1 Tax=Bombilactobacillus bombi TaxID=1303590 RepID=A0A417Z5Y3_9LACO|nr:HAD-IA family hydrolase [Bombilactobacillus bombi]MCO6543884.1 HAD-IA family hydrolase [Lactobacillus sp.]RHW46043.1 haloacid dehalogenase [Bombilactobacillus bombi]
MVLQNAIWDFDGTLADTYPGILASLQKTLQDFNYPIQDASELYRFIKLHSVKEYWHQLVPDENYEKIYQYFQQVDHQMQKQISLLPHAQMTLQKIVDHGGHNYLWTHRDNLVWQLLDQNNIGQYFEDVITSQDEFARKPDPAAINSLVAKHNLLPVQTAMIGDRSLDIQAGQNANVQTIYYDVDQFHDDHQASYIVQDLQEIVTLFEKD